jgi:protein phosphatase
MMEDEDLQAILEEGGGLEEQVDRLIAEANRRGGLDNITAIVIRIETSDTPSGEYPVVGAR